MIVSMQHDVRGKVELNGVTMNFDDGVGYLEGDRGTSFPAGYSWTQCNVWEQDPANCSIVAAAAKIPFMGTKFWGCFAVVWHEGKEYRLATYKKAKIKRRTPSQLIISQGNLKLTVIVTEAAGHKLYAPDNGSMRRTIHESAAVRARYIFEVDNRVVIDRWSNCASYEYDE